MDSPAQGEGRGGWRRVIWFVAIYAASLAAFAAVVYSLRTFNSYFKPPPPRVQQQGALPPSAAEWPALLARVEGGRTPT